MRQNPGAQLPYERRVAGHSRPPGRRSRNSPTAVATPNPAREGATPSRAAAAVIAAALLAIVQLPGSAPAQSTCVGDCDGGGRVEIGEVVRCVRMALQMAIDRCAACDADNDGSVLVAEIVQAVQRLLGSCGKSATPTPTPPAGFCGNGRTDVAGETCDDGNTVGGDGCAGNCTTEVRRAAVFDTSRTRAGVQTAALPVALELSGSQVLTTGRPRSEPARGAGGALLFAAGEIPVVIRAADLRFEPVSVPGLRCACARGVEVPEFGAGNAARGSIACGSAPAFDFDVELSQDHNTAPGDPGNGGTALGHLDDPECDDAVDSSERFPIPAHACAEGVDAECPLPLSYHVDVCNGPRRVAYGGGAAPRGTALIVARIAIGLLEDTGRCHDVPPRRPDNSCVYEDYGADCLPCTDDDLDRGVAQTIPITTATASARIFDVNNNAGGLIAPGADCIRPCDASATGSVFDCDALAAASGGLSGSALAGCFPMLDSRTLGDNVVCTVLASE